MFTFFRVFVCFSHAYCVYDYKKRFNSIDFIVVVKIVAIKFYFYFCFFLFIIKIWIVE